ncbi:MAG TPA: hypothetical protein VJN93_03770 [Candidatus Acidoferrum sp.]|nr:hypothetical protein [Candidatus Acidoferrum sp.]
MGTLPHPVEWLWGVSVVAQIAVLLAALLHENYRRLPFFVLYAALNLSQAAYLLVLYSLPHLAGPRALSLAWDSEMVTLLAQGLATTEVLAAALKPYQGIWGLGWRALTAVSTLVIVVVVAVSYRDAPRVWWFDLNRGYHITFAAAVIACLLVIRYYSIRVPAAFKVILGGFCLYSCTEILINTIVQAMFHKHFETYASVWHFSTLCSFLIVQCMWVAALRHPLPALAAPATQTADSMYRQLSPEINAQLRELNEKLLRLWKPEAHPN